MRISTHKIRDRVTALLAADKQQRKGFTVCEGMAVDLGTGTVIARRVDLFEYREGQPDSTTGLQEH